MVERLLFSIWTNRFPFPQCTKPHEHIYTYTTYLDTLCTVRTVTLPHIHTKTRQSQQSTYVSHILNREGLAPRESRLELPLRNQIHFIKLPDVTTNPLPMDAAFTRQQHGDIAGWTQTWSKWTQDKNKCWGRKICLYVLVCGDKCISKEKTFDCPPS